MEKIPTEGPVLLVCNHRHWVDPLLLLGLTKRKIRIMAKEELFSNRFLAYAFRKFGVFSIKRGENDMAAIRLSLQILQEGNVLLLFPEGTRNRVEGSLLPLKPGTSLLALKSGAKVVPCFMTGKVRFFGKINIAVGDPISMEGFSQKRVSSSDMANFNEKIQNELLALGHAYLLK